MLADPIVHPTNEQYVSSACIPASTPQNDTYNVAFPPELPLYPGGKPVAISAVYFVNDGLNPQAIKNSFGKLQLVAPNGTVVAQRSLLSTNVTSFIFISPSPAPTPRPADVTTLKTQSQAVRYVRLTAAPGQCLSFREIFVFDDTTTNVAILRNASSNSLGQVSHSLQYGASNGLFAPSQGVNGIITMDATPGSPADDGFISATCDGTATWQVDLLAVYNITSVIVWNYWQFGGAMSGATLELLNGFHNPLRFANLTGDMVQTITIPSFTLSSPTPTISESASPSASSSASPSASESASAAPVEYSSSATASASGSASSAPGAYTSSSATASASASASSASGVHASSSASASGSASGSGSGSATPLPARAPPSSSASASSSASGSSSVSGSSSPSPLNNAPSVSASASASASASSVEARHASASSSGSPSAAAEHGATSSASASGSASGSAAPLQPEGRTASASASGSASASASVEPSQSPTSTGTATRSKSHSKSRSKSHSRTRSHSHGKPKRDNVHGRRGGCGHGGKCHNASPFPTDSPHPTRRIPSPSRTLTKSRAVPSATSTPRTRTSTPKGLCGHGGKCYNASPFPTRSPHPTRRIPSPSGTVSRTHRVPSRTATPRSASAKPAALCGHGGKCYNASPVPTRSPRHVAAAPVRNGAAAIPKLPTLSQGAAAAPARKSGQRKMQALTRRPAADIASGGELSGTVDVAQQQPEASRAKAQRAKRVPQRTASRAAQGALPTRSLDSDAVAVEGETLSSATHESRSPPQPRTAATASAAGVIVGDAPVLSKATVRKQRVGAVSSHEGGQRVNATLAEVKRTEGGLRKNKKGARKM